MNDNQNIPKEPETGLKISSAVTPPCKPQLNDHTEEIAVDKAAEASSRADEQRQINSIRASLKRITTEKASEIMGGQMFGPENVKTAFGVELASNEIPEIRYSAEQLTEAKKNGKLLVLRINRSADGQPLNLRNLLLASGTKVSGQTNAEELTTGEVFKGLDFLEKEVPKLEWKLVSTKPIKGTEYLSYKAQTALLKKDVEGGVRGKADTVSYWKEIWGESFENGPTDSVQQALQNMPDSDQLVDMMDKLPANASLPSMAEAVYDHLLVQTKSKASLTPNRCVATSSVMPPDLDDIHPADRPWDIHFKKNGEIVIHFRRSDRMGRPTKLGSLDAGVPIAYIQH